MSTSIVKILITARIRRMGECTVFSWLVHTSTGGGGLPHPDEGQVRIEVPPSPSAGCEYSSWSRSGLGWGTHNWNNIACNCYAPGGMTFAFTQEDFLVFSRRWIFWIKRRVREREACVDFGQYVC